PLTQPLAPLALAAWLLAQPLLAAAAVQALGYQFEPGLAASAWRRGLPALLLWLAAAVLVAGMVGFAFWRVLDTAALGWVLGTSAAATAAWLLLWRAWPAVVLPFLWHQATALQGPWPFAAALGSIAFARRILQRGDAGAARGLLAAAAVLLLATAPAALLVLSLRGLVAAPWPWWIALALLAAPLPLGPGAGAAAALSG